MAGAHHYGKTTWALWCSELSYVWLTVPGNEKTRIAHRQCGWVSPATSGAESRQAPRDGRMRLLRRRVGPAHREMRDRPSLHRQP